MCRCTCLWGCMEVRGHGQDLFTTQFPTSFSGKVFQWTWGLMSGNLQGPTSLWPLELWHYLLGSTKPIAYIPETQYYPTLNGPLFKILLCSIWYPPKSLPVLARCNFLHFLPSMSSSDLPQCSPELFSYLSSFIYSQILAFFHDVNALGLIRTVNLDF